MGYVGGKSSAPTYSSVCAGDGHSEAVKIVYDADALSYDQLLDKFFQLHNYQYRSKAQYMSAIFAQTDEQKRIAEDKIKQLRGKVATEIKDKTVWHDAEEYHQKFLKKQKRGFASRFFS